MPFDRVTSRLVALHDRDYRLLWSGQVSSTIAQQMQLIALNWNVYALLRETSATVNVFGAEINLNASALGLGGLSLARVLPIFLFAVPGGLLADMVNRRRLMMVTQSCGMLIAATLAFASLTGRATVPILYLAAAASGTVVALESPARESLLPNLVPRAHLLNAMSLYTMLITIGTIVGPLVAGVLADAASLGLVYALTALLFLPALVTLASMHDPAQDRLPKQQLGLRDVAQGFRFTYRTREIWGTMMVDFLATVLGSARTMLPIVAGDLLGVGAAGYGLLATAQPVGSVLAGTTVSLRRDILRQGLVFLVCVATYGAATALFGLSTVFVLSYLLWGATGAADTVSSIIRGTIRQSLTPDDLRGRMVGVNMMFYSGGPQLGEVRAGLVAAAFGAPFAIVSGGVSVLIVVVVAAWRSPRLRTYKSETVRGHPNATATAS
ncbi:MAG: MFS transporter [Caldilineaceae bacterium]